MFVRKKRSVRNGLEYEYLQIVRSFRQGEKVRQEVIATLGRADKLLISGEIDGLLHSLAKFSDKLRVVEANRSPDLQAHRSLEWGPALVFGRLWERQGIPAIIKMLSQDRKFEFDIERATFAMALQRLCEPGSDLGGSQWVTNVEIPEFHELALHHFYRYCCVSRRGPLRDRDRTVLAGSGPVQSGLRPDVYRHHERLCVPRYRERTVQERSLT